MHFGTLKQFDQRVSASTLVPSATADGWVAHMYVKRLGEVSCIFLRTGQSPSTGMRKEKFLGTCMNESQFVETAEARFSGADKCRISNLPELIK